MMIPPVIRMGVPPVETYPRKTGFVVLIEKRGWAIVKFLPNEGIFMDTDAGIPREFRLVHPSRILCWMPEDGS